MEHVEPHARDAVRLPATAPVYFFEELQEVLPTCVAYEHGEDYWWNIGYFYDTFLGLLQGERLESSSKFTTSIAKKVGEDDVQKNLGACVYIKPSLASGRPG